MAADPRDVDLRAAALVTLLSFLKTYKPSGLAAYFLTTPIFGVFLSWLILDEVITFRLLASAALVVVGIALTSRPSAALERPAMGKQPVEEA
jgi:drug/metabolite transporter (DMT)-like permease